MQTTHLTPKSLLKNTFGFDQFRPLQEEIINGLIAGNDQFVLMPTGGGKSLCFQIPAILRKGVGIVVSPLISLMHDQVTALQENGVGARYYNSSLTYAQTLEIRALLHAGRLDLLYVSPERLMQPEFSEFLKTIPLSIIAIDEAHCISQWGPDFRPEYAQLNRVRDLFAQVPIIAVTATADPQTRIDIQKQLGLERAQSHIASFDRPNIRYTLIEKHQPAQQLLNLIAQKSGESGIIYCMTRKRTEEITERLNAHGISALAYHAGIPTKKRQAIQDSFQKDDTPIIAATVAFGMGIDKPNVRFVIHYDLPKTIEHYYQETGRAGRDGLPSEAILFYGVGDAARMRGMIESTQNEELRRLETHKLGAMIAFAEAQHCRRRILLNYFGEILEDPCGNCDTCLSPPETFDATLLTQKALSCVYRLKESFGLIYVVDVLRGSENARIKNFRHDQLSTYGIGKETHKEIWYSIFRQLIHLGYLIQDLSHYSVLKLTDKALNFLKKKETLTLAQPQIRATRSKPIRNTALTKFNLVYDKALFEKLRALRKKLADENNIPPFMVFSDASLVQLCIEQPKNEAEFLKVNGVGIKKLASYGAAFIAALWDKVPS